MIVPTTASWVLAIILIDTFASGQRVLRNITVDDTNPAITYVGSWSNDSDGESYEGGHRSSTGANAAGTFTFTGIAVYYLMPLFTDNTGQMSTLLSLDSRPAQLVNLTRAGSESARSAVRWSATGLTNGRHTLVSSPGRSANGQVAGWAKVDGFTYTVQGPGPNAVNIPNDRITFNPPGTWSNSSTNLPSCAMGKSVMSTSVKDANFSFDFTGDTVYIHTINNPGGGRFSLSINGGPEEIYETHADTTQCGFSSQKMLLTVKVERSLESRDGANIITGKIYGDGEVPVDGASAEQSSVSAAHRTSISNRKFCVGTILFISSLFLYGFV